MERKIPCILLILAILSMVLSAGCAAPGEKANPAVSPDSTSSRTFNTVPSGTSSVASGTPPVVATSPALATPATEGTREPLIEPYVSVNAIKRTTYNIPNCTMGQLVPEVNAPGYGLNSIKEANLHFMSAGDFNKVIREYTENRDAFSVCYGVPETPYWGFVNVIGTLTARNSRPAPYQISMVVIFRGTEGPAYQTEMILNPGQEYPYSIYIPIKVDQIQSIEGITFRFDEANRTGGIPGNG